MTRSLGSGGGGVGGTGFFAGRFAVVVLTAGFAGGLETGRFAVVFAVGFLAAGFRFCVPVGLAAVGFFAGDFPCEAAVARLPDDRFGGVPPARGFPAFSAAGRSEQADKFSFFHLKGNII